MNKERELSVKIGDVDVLWMTGNPEYTGDFLEISINPEQESPEPQQVVTFEGDQIKLLQSFLNTVYPNKNIFTVSLNATADFDMDKLRTLYELLHEEFGGEA